MISSGGKKIFFIGFIALIIIGVGIIPLFIPPYIYDYSHVNWNGADLSEGITGDQAYFENFQNFTQPTDLYVYDVRGLPYDQQLVLTTLQGLVNRENTSLYLIYRQSDQFWLERLREYYSVNYTNLNNETFWQLIERYNSSFKGIIIYDPNFLDTVNVACFLAGMNESVVIHPEMLNNFTSQGFNVTWDFRGNFTSRTSLYNWAFDSFWPLANHKMIASWDPTKVYFRDYIVGSSPPIFTFWLEVGPFGDPEEIQLFRRIIEETPPNIPVWGWFYDPGGAVGEYEAVKTISHSGKFSFCAAVPDLTVLSAFNDSALIQNPVSFNVSSFPIENKIYASVIVSDGDNVGYCSSYLLNEIWQDPDRGTVPLGFTLEPFLVRIAPVVLRYYYENATDNEYFLAGPSGAGYCYVDMNPSFPNFLNTTKYAMDQCDMQQVWLLNGYEGFQPIYSDEVLNAYTSPNCNFTGIYLDYHDFQAESNYLLNGVPVFHSIWVERENEIIGKLNSIASTNPDAPIFLFIACNSWDFDITTIKNVANALPDAVFLRPDHFAELFKRYQLELQAETWLDESRVLFFTVIPFIVIIVALAAMWLFLKNKSKDTQNIKSSLGETTFRTTFKFFYILLDIGLLLTIRVCLYSTILSVIYILFLMISMILGIYLKKMLEKVIGPRETISLALGLAAVGILLFAISPQFTIILGFSFGILLSQQVQSNHLLFNSLELGKKSFLYSLLIAITIILLVPFQYYSQLLWVIALIFTISSIILIILLKDSRLPYFRGFSTNIRYWYPKGVLFGMLFMFLLSPTFASERFFFYLSWGIEYFPTRITIGFAVAIAYLSAILLAEVLRMKNLSLSKVKASIVFILGVTCYIFVPYLIQNPFGFVLTHFLFIFGLFAVIDSYIIGSLPFSKLGETTTMNNDPRGFTSQFAFWIIIGLLLLFIPSTILVVDSQAIFTFVGLTGIEQLTWSPAFWTLFYTPPIYMFLVVPLTIYVLIYGIIKTLS